MFAMIKILFLYCWALVLPIFGLQAIKSSDDLVYDDNEYLKYHYLLTSDSDSCAPVAADSWELTPNKALRIVAPYSVDTSFGFKLIQEVVAIKEAVVKEELCLFIALEKGTPRRLVTHVIRPNVFFYRNGHTSKTELYQWLKDIQKVEIGVTAAYHGLPVLIVCEADGVRNLLELEPGNHGGCFADLGSAVQVITNYTFVDDSRGRYRGISLNNWRAESNSVFFTAYFDDKGRKQQPTRSRLMSKNQKNAYEENNFEKAGIHMTSEQRRDVVKAMIEESVRRSREVRRTFSPHGFKVGRLPPDLWASMSAYYYNNLNNGIREFWAPTHVIVNHHESSSRMLFPPSSLHSYWQKRLMGLVQAWVDERLDLLEFTKIYEENSNSMHFDEDPVGGEGMSCMGKSSLATEFVYHDERYSENNDNIQLREDVQRSCYNHRVKTGHFKIEQTSLYGVREYSGMSRLLQHVDITDTHAASIIINVAQFGVREPWPLEIFDHSGRLHQIVMTEGDILYYESAANLHARTDAFQGERFANIFAHFRPLLSNGEGDKMWHSRENPFGTPPPIRKRCDLTATSDGSCTGCGNRGGGGRGTNRKIDDEIFLNSKLILVAENSTVEDTLFRQWWNKMLSPKEKKIFSLSLNP